MALLTEMYGRKFIQVHFIFSNANNRQNFQTALLASLSNRFWQYAASGAFPHNTAHPPALQETELVLLPSIAHCNNLAPFFTLESECVVLNLVQYLVAQ